MKIFINYFYLGLITLTASSALLSMKRVADSENNYCVFSDQINKENNYECQIMFTDGKDNDYQIINFRNGPQSVALLDITYAITLKANPFTKVLLSDDEKERIKIYHRAYQ